jgi:hypothetical protein
VETASCVPSNLFKLYSIYSAYKLTQAWQRSCLHEPKDNEVICQVNIRVLFFIFCGEAKLAT